MWRGVRPAPGWRRPARPRGGGAPWARARPPGDGPRTRAAAGPAAGRDAVEGGEGGRGGPDPFSEQRTAGQPHGAQRIPVPYQVPDLRLPGVAAPPYRVVQRVVGPVLAA